MSPASGAGTILVKRYAQSRLYDAKAGRYLTVDDLLHWASAGIRFVVVDAKTGEDVTDVMLP
jgi:polyhydroxyalkanoate synthesis regulator protein